MKLYETSKIVYPNSLVKLWSDNNGDNPTKFNLLPLFFAVDDTEVEGVTTGLTLIETLVDTALDVVVSLM